MLELVISNSKRLNRLNKYKRNLLSVSRRVACSTFDVLASAEVALSSVMSVAAIDSLLPTPIELWIFAVAVLAQAASPPKFSSEEKRVPSAGRRKDLKKWVGWDYSENERWGIFICINIHHS